MSVTPAKQLCAVLSLVLVTTLAFPATCRDIIRSDSNSFDGHSIDPTSFIKTHNRSPLSSGELYGPHERPADQTGPWFEGWYLRVTSSSEGSFSIGLGSFPGGWHAEPSRQSC